MTRFYYYILFLAMQLCTQSLYAQHPPTAVEGGTTSKVRFEDDFSGDTLWHFPYRWSVVSGDKSNGVVIADKGFKAFYSKETDSCTLISPRTDGRPLRSDSMSITFGFYFEDRGSILGVGFHAYDDRSWDILFRLTNRGEMGLGLECISQFSAYFRSKEKNVMAVSTGKWHQIKLTFYNGDINVLLDGRLEASFPATGYYPVKFYLSVCHHTRIRTFLLNAKNSEYDFSSIVSHGGIVTHALQFDVNQSVIKRDHAAFLVHLSDFLRANPGVKLEIAGHTDSDGDATANTRLSQARADAIMQYLVNGGISAARLEAKGYGASRPLRSNATDDGRAANRRVEFKKL